LTVAESGFDSKKKKRQKVSPHRHIQSGCGVEQDSYAVGTKHIFPW